MTGAWARFARIGTTLVVKVGLSAGTRRALSHAMRTFVPLALLVLATGCGATVTGDGDSDCGPKPVSAGDCPPAWNCIDGDWVDTAGACPNPTCPDVEPEYGSACAFVGSKCSYTNDVPCGELTNELAECTDDGWVIYANRCEPPPECPNEMPVAGSDCTGWEYAYWCPYDVSCGGPEVSQATVSCDTSMSTPSWRVDSTATCQDCGQLGNSASCAASAGCQWLTPGCDSNVPSVYEGCYSTSDCNANGCDDPNATCSTYAYNPCPDGTCDACAAPFGVCELLLE